MIQDKILYTDGHDVTITDSMFMVRNMSYRLIGITKHGLHIVKPHRLPGYMLFMLGVILTVCGFLNLTPENIVPSANVFGVALSANAIVMCAGAGLAFIGILII